MDQKVLKKIDEFFDNYPSQTVGSGTLLISADENPDGIYKIDSGRVIEYDITKDGARIVVNVFQKHAFFPMSSTLNNYPNRYYFEAHGECTFRKATTEETLAFVESEPDVLLDLLARVYRGIDGFQRRMVFMATENAKKRLAFELLLSAQRFGEKLDVDLYSIPLSESDLAANAGLTRETVNREIAKLKKLGLVTVESRRLYVSSLVELEKYLDA